MKTKNVAEVMVEQLVAWGVQRVYGLAGDANLYFLDALQRHPSIRFIQTRHEGAAAMMASAEAKLTGKVGVCTATSGPGMVNLLNGLADAYADQAPVLAITGQVPGQKIGFPVKQQIDQQVMIQPLALWSSLLVSAEKAAELTWLGLHYAETRGGVTHISVLKDIWNQSGGKEIKPPPRLKSRGLVRNDEVKPLAAAIDKALRPVLMVGRGIAGVEPEVLALAEQRGMPIITTLPAKGLIPEEYHLCVGGIGQAGTEATSNLIRQADLILILGATWWPQAYIAKDALVIQIDAYQPNLSLKHPTVQVIQAYLDEVLPLLLDEVKAVAAEEWLAQIRQERERWFTKIRAERQSLAYPIPPQFVMAELEKYTPEDAIIVLDVGDHVIWFDRCYWGRNKDLLISGTWRTMGFGLPAAIAAKLVCPERQVLLITGDGGLTMASSEVVTAWQHHTAVKAVVINNGALAMEENRAITAGLLKEGTTLVNPDFVGLAQACGWQAKGIQRGEELGQTLQECLASNQPYLVDVKCSKPMPPNTKL